MPQPILVLVESQTKCKKIEQYLGPGYKVMATFGHIMKLKSLENIEIENNFKCNYELIDDANKIRTIELLRQNINNSSEVILACDNDREGEAICAAICRYYQLPIETTKRIIFTEITEQAIIQAIKNPTFVNVNLVNAQNAREVLDVLVGFTVSPILWKSISKHHKTSLSAGRCQTPALRLVYDNYLELKNNSSKIIYRVYGIFTSMNLKFELNKEFEINEKEIQGEENNELIDFLNLCPNFHFKFDGLKINSTSRNSPEPLTTSRLQQTCSNLLNLSPKDTMKYAQELYEEGLITYMRTDCDKYCEEFIQKTTQYIISNYSENYVKENIGDYIKPINSGNPHEAIRPVDISNDINLFNISVKAKKMYELIWKHSIQSCMSKSRYNIITCVIKAPNEFDFLHKMEENIFQGWEAIENENNITTTAGIQFVKNLIPNVIIPYKKINTQFALIGRKMHLTEAGLVKLLEELGIGRSSTFATLVEKIQFRKYVEKKDIEGIEIFGFDYELPKQTQQKQTQQHQQTQIIKKQVSKVVGSEKNKLVMTPLGILVIEFLIEKMNELFNYEYTRNMENDLDVISNGEKEWQSLCRECYDHLTNVTQSMMDASTFSLKIDNNHMLIMGKYGPVIKSLNNYGKFNGFIKVRDDLDLDELRERQNIKLEDVIDDKSSQETSANSEPIGKYKGQDLYIKKGKYGIYAQWGNERKSLKEEFGTNVHNINYVDLLRYLEKDNLLDPNKPIGFVRELTENISIRNGKYGDYIHYKKPRVKNPVFISLKGFEDNHRTCDKQILLNWLKLNCGIKIV